MILLTNGDSHTAGGEIEYEYQPDCYEKAWPQKLSNKLNYTSVNISRSGNSNQSIYRTTQDWVIKNILIEKTYKPSEVLVMVMWSSFDRHEVYFPDINYLDNINPHLDPILIHTKMTQEIIDLQKSIVSFHDNLNSDFRALSTVTNLSNWLSSIGVKHFFLNGISWFPEINYLNSNYNHHALYESYKNLLFMYGNKNINSHYGFSNPYDTFVKHMIEYSGIKKPKHAINLHYGEDGHEYWANKIYDIFFKNTSKKLL